MSPSPQLHFAGIELPFTSDELGIPANCASIARIPFLALNVLLLFLVTGTFGLTGCEISTKQDGHLLAYVATSLVILLGTLLNYIMIHGCSRIGNIFEPEKRENITYLLYSLAMLYLFECGASFYGTWIAISWNIRDADSQLCEQRNHQKIALLAAWLVFMWIDVILFVVLSILLSLRPGRRRKRVKGFELDEYGTSELHWYACCLSWTMWSRFLSCGLTGTIGIGEETERALENAAEVFSQWFTGHDLSRSSDVLIAIILLRAEQNARHEEFLREIWDEDASFRKSLDDPHRKYSLEINRYLWGPPKPQFKHQFSLELFKDVASGYPSKGLFPDFEMKPSGRLLEKKDPASVEQLQLAANYVIYSLAINGYLMKILLDVKNVRPYSCGKTFFPCGTPTYDGDCCFGVNSSAFLKISNLNPKDILHASWASCEAKVIPYAIIVDHKLRSVIVTCQGTQDLSGALTNAMIQPTSLVIAGKQWRFNGENHYCHSGFLAVAETLRNQLQNHKILHKVLGVSPVSEVSDGFVESHEECSSTDTSNLPHCIGYKLIIVGHSLGGGVAAVLSLLLRSEFPDLQCIAYSAPGCVFSKTLAEKSQDWILMPYCGKDIVPHLSWHTLSKLRRQLLKMLWRARANKNVILSSILVPTSVENLLFSEDEVPPERASILEQLESLKAVETSTSETFKRNLHIKMYCPGKILHFARTKKMKKNLFCCSTSQPEFQPSWVYDRTDMNKVIVSANMFLDHFKLSSSFFEEILESYI